MRPSFQLLDRALIERVLDEAFEILETRGVRVGDAEAIELLHSAGARVDDGVVQIPAPVARRALASAPREFWLYDRGGNAVVRYHGDAIHFAPGSSCLKLLDPDTLMPRLAQSSDLVRLLQVAEMLPQYAAQSTALVCDDVPKSIADFYRLVLVLRHSGKPAVTGSYSTEGLGRMLELLRLEAGGDQALRARPRAVFDVCPSPPLNWSEFAAGNILQLARAGVPPEIVAMPLAGATGPVTLVGSLVQHAAETIAGITLHQLAAAGAPIVWGGAPAIFDMRYGTFPVGAMESAMLNAACCEVGKYLGLPTHAYLVASDSKLPDAQAALESALSAAVGALAGINMISGAGMLDSLACHSIEKLVMDAEIIASLQRLVAGLEVRTEPLAAAMIAAAGWEDGFLRLPETRALFRSEQHFPSAVIDRESLTDGERPTDTLCRARTRVNELLAQYQPPVLPPEREAAVRDFALRECRQAGLDHLPGF